MGFFSPGTSLGGGVFHRTYVKLDPDIPESFRVDSLYYVLENMVIESPTITEDIIITSLPKTMAKMHFLLNWSHYVKSYGHFCQILALLTILAHQIWSCHVT